MNIFLVRHAKIASDGKGIVQGLDDPIVSDVETKSGAEATRKVIPSPDKIYSSELLRAKQTVALIYPERRDAIVSGLLNEYVRPSKYIGGPMEKLAGFWKAHPVEKYDRYWKPEDGESYAECAARAEAFHRQLVADRDSGIRTVCVVGHGTLFRHLVCALVGVDEWKSNPRIVIDLLRKFPWQNLECKEFEL